MNRRILSRAGLGVFAVGIIGISDMAAQTPEPTALRVEGEWNATQVADGSIDRFATVITAYRSINEAEDALNEAVEQVQEGTIWNEATQTETFGDESFFVEYNNVGYFLVYEANVRVSNLVYHFRWETANYGGARAGHRLFEKVIDRVEVKDRYTEDELLALLPTKKELEKYSLA